MATLVLNPVAEEAELRKKEATAHWKAIQQSGPLVSTNSLRIGFHAAALKRDGMFGIIGFADEKEAQEASGVCDSTWYANIRLAEQFPGISEALFCSMKQANAKVLANLPESKRLTECWIRRAGVDSMELFRTVVEEELDGKAKASDGKEPTVSMGFKLPKSAKKAIQSGLKEFAKEVGVDGDESKALELIVAEHTGAVSLLGSITRAVERIGNIKKLAESGLSAEEILSRTLEELDAMGAELTQAVLAAQNVSNVD